MITEVSPQVLNTSYLTKNYYQQEEQYCKYFQVTTTYFFDERNC